jgi:hypothetical protein
MHNLFLVYFVNLYLFRVYLGPSSGGTTVCIQHWVLVFVFRRLSVVLVELELMYAVVFSWSWPRVEPVGKVWLSIHRCIHSLIRVGVTDSESLFRHICCFDFVYESCFSNVFRHTRNCEKRQLASLCLSVCPHGKTRLPLNVFSRNLIFIFENLSSTFKFHWNLTRITGALREDQCTFLIISRSVLLRMRNDS